MGQVQSLVGELRSYKPCGMPPPKKNHTHTHKVGEKEKEDEEEEVGRKGGRQAGREGEMNECKRERFNKEHLMMKDH